MIISLQFGFSQFISFREEDLWNISQSEHIIGPGSHVEYPTGMKNRNFVEDHPRNIPAKFGFNWPSGFWEEAWNVKSLQTTDDGCQVMAIVPMNLWSRWTKKPILHYLRVYFTSSFDRKVTYLSLYFLVWWKSLHDKINLIAKRRYIENIQNMVDKNSMNI